MGEIGKTSEMDLAGICNGGVSRQFAAALEKVALSIIDPNTDATKKRVITIKVEFEPNKERSVIDVTGTVEVKTPGASSVQTLVYTQQRPGGKVALLEHTPPEQTQLNIVEQLRPRVVGGTDTTEKD